MCGDFHQKMKTDAPSFITNGSKTLSEIPRISFTPANHNFSRNKNTMQINLFKGSQPPNFGNC